MNVTSLKLSQELFEVSGWSDTTYEYWGVQKRLEVRTILNTDSAATPAYDSGYLLAKLPNMMFEWWNQDSIHLIYHTASGENVSIDADTPANALAKLCLELFKSGILTKEGA